MLDDLGFCNTTVRGLTASCFTSESGVMFNLQSKVPPVVLGKEETTGSPFGPSTGLIRVRLGVSG